MLPDMRFHPRTMCFLGPGKRGVGLQVPREGKLEQWFLVRHQVTDSSAFDECFNHRDIAALLLLSS